MPTYHAVVEDSAPIPLPEEIATNDEAVIAALAPYYPEAAEAEIERETDADGNVTVKVTPVGKTKG